MADDVSPDRNHDPKRLAAQAARDRNLLARLLTPVTGRGLKARAADLLQQYGSLPALLTACRDPSAEDPILKHLAIIDEVLHSVALGRLSTRPLLPSLAATAEYLMLDMAMLSVEQVRVIFLNARNRLIAEEIVTNGTIDQAPIFPREVVKRALEVGAASIILAHNHPSGDPKPSTQDIAVTRLVQEGGRPLGIVLHDHLIFASGGWTSFRAEGLL